MSHYTMRDSSGCKRCLLALDLDLVLDFDNSMTLGKLHNISMPQFPHLLKIGIKSGYQPYVSEEQISMSGSTL